MEHRIAPVKFPLHDMCGVYTGHEKHTYSSEDIFATFYV